VKGNFVYPVEEPNFLRTSKQVGSRVTKLYVLTLSCPISFPLSCNRNAKFPLFLLVRPVCIGRGMNFAYQFSVFHVSCIT